MRCDDIQCSDERLRERRSMAACIGLAGRTAGANTMPGLILMDGKMDGIDVAGGFFVLL